MLTEPDPSLVPFSAPQGVALIGVSHDPAKLGYGIALNLVNSGYRGAIHFVNPKGGRVLNRPVYAEIAAIPDPVDLAVILVPPTAVPATLEACGARGVRAAIIASGGFREVGAEGAALEERCLAIARAHGIRLIGPNCIGLIDTHLPLDTTFLQPPMPPAGDIAFLSHSGAVCAAVVDWSRGQGFGFSRLVSLGNQADVTETDMLGPVAADPHTRAITLYLEGIGDGRRFVEAARRVTRRQPLLARKAGRTRGGRRAAASHTGALAGEEAAYDAAFRRAGVLRAPTTAELFDWARALAWCPLPQGPGVAVLGNAGSPAVIAADALETQGLALARLAEGTESSLREMLVSAASVANPVDMLASATAEQYTAALDLLLNDDGVHAVLVILPPPPVGTAGGVARQLLPLIQAATKPVVIALLGHGLVQEALAYFRAARVPAYPFPEAAVGALAALARRAGYLQEEHEPLPEPEGVDRAAAARLLAEARPGWLPPESATALLAAYGIPVVAGCLAQNAAEAAAAAEAFGFPVALKISSPDIPHKSDVGGVVLDLRDAPAVRAAYAAMVAGVQAARPEARLEGALVQRMVPQGQEVIAGVTRDAQFGPLLMFGSGGVEVEALGDVAFALAPVSAADAGYLLRETWAGRKLGGYRDIPAADAAAVRDVLVRLCHLCVAHSQVAEVEINPLRALPRGVVALDARIRVHGDNPAIQLP